MERKIILELCQPWAATLMVQRSRLTAAERATITDKSRQPTATDASLAERHVSESWVGLQNRDLTYDCGQFSRDHQSSRREEERKSEQVPRKICVIVPEKARALMKS
ncbi:uncharacterized protein RSE6_13482 [Rhynchosporium secalis]|uniref:Uncharacterized protein n=1 Tax=Rhynchosporium secalis TaxID=38038 RepID=A0A1E1MTT7_RHYSE|nr:uncharacterized protein RSE6_13482 [Rhynchosporium secalis]